ncbi:MAG: hypothetical protein JW889_04520 [Verrucomicrobia bacterium]|nr:hypothetical protein [Verrucomicrobiota bacterium]
MRKRRPTQIKSKVFNYQVANRRSHAGSNRWIHGVIVLVLIAVAAGIVYVWLRNRELNSGYTVTELRKEIKEIKEDRIKAEAKVYKLREPARIQREVKERRLGLVQPQPGQVIHLDDPPPLVLADEGKAPEQPAGRRLWDAIVLGER